MKCEACNKKAAYKVAGSYCCGMHLGVMLRVNAPLSQSSATATRIIPWR